MTGSYSKLFLLFLLSASYGCLSVPANSGKTNFSSYAESVFRRQNEISSKLMMLNDNEQLGDNQDLEDGETSMIEACHLLNDYAEQDGNGDSMSWSFKAKVQSSIEGCDNSIKRIEVLLEKLIPGPKL